MRKTIKQLQGESDYWRIKFINEQQRAEAAEAKLTELENFNRVDDKLKLVLTERLKKAEAKVEGLNSGILSLIPDCRYMDPPDGGDVTPLEQLSRMIAELRSAPAVSLNAVSNCLSFFASVIKSGESWSETCQRDLDAAREALSNIEGANK